MCRFCDWDERFAGDEIADPEAAAERQRASQDSWARLMEEINRADAAADARGAKAAE